MRDAHGGTRHLAGAAAARKHPGRGGEHGAGLGKVAQPIRVAVSGGSVSPPIDGTLEILGRETTLKRLDAAILYIQP